jgi:membrane dipeptidase
MKIFDGHNDILDRILESGDLNSTGFLKPSPGHLDLPKARQGGFAGGLFAVYPPNPPEVPPSEERMIYHDDGYEVEIAPPLDYDYSLRTATRMIELLRKIEADAKGKFQVVTNTQELQDCLDNDILAAVLHLEGAEPIRPDLSNFEDFYQLGMRSLGLVWSRPNAFGHGVPFKYPSGPNTGPGLTPAGKDLIQACNSMGVMIDLAHLNEKGFWTVAELSSDPLVSSHTAAHGLIPKARNLTDEQLKAIRVTNGLVGVIFSVNDLAGESRPRKDGPISAIIDHIRYIADLIGVDHVAFGSDFDGTVIPSELGDASQFQKLVDLLREAGFSEQELEKICYKNWLRVLETTWKDSSS